MVDGVPMQGDIISIGSDPRRGHEQQGYRPFVCLSNKLISDYANIAVFAPISNTTRRYPLYIPLSGTQTSGSVMLDQLITIDYSARNFQYIETIPAVLLQELLKKAALVFQPN
jgi:mRNA interferase MazF